MAEKTVTLSLATLIRECSNNSFLERDHFYFFSLANRENIHEIFKYKKFNDDFTDTLACYNDGEYVVGTIGPSYDEFLDKLLTILNIRHTNKVKDDDELTKKMNERLEVLRNITTEAELALQFPILYKDLKDGRKYFSDLQKLKRQEHISDEQFASGEHYYYSCALKKSLPNFIETQAKMYERYINDRKKLKCLQESKSYNNYIRKHFNINKLYIYVAHEYLRKAESSKDREEINKYIKLVEKYLSSPVSKDVSITTDEGIKVDIDNIKKRLDNLKRIIADNSSLVDWVLIPEGRRYDRVTKSEGEEARVTIFDKDEIERLRSLGERKTVFYESTPYVAKAIGLRRYKGYVAYIYENGEIILDREYDTSYPKTLKDNAIYNLKVTDFETLSKLDKQTLIKNPRVGRIYHTKTWEDRTRLIIEREATEEEKEQTKLLIKRLKEKNS